MFGAFCTIFRAGPVWKGSGAQFGRKTAHHQPKLKSGFEFPIMSLLTYTGFYVSCPPPDSLYRPAPPARVARPAGRHRPSPAGLGDWSPDPGLPPTSPRSPPIRPRFEVCFGAIAPRTPDGLRSGLDRRRFGLAASSDPNFSGFAKLY